VFVTSLIFEGEVGNLVKSEGPLRFSTMVGSCLSEGSRLVGEGVIYKKKNFITSALSPIVFRYLCPNFKINSNQ